MLKSNENSLKNLKAMYIFTCALQILAAIFWFVPSINYEVDDVLDSESLAECFYNRGFLVAIMAFFAVSAIIILLPVFTSTHTKKYFIVFPIVSAVFSIFMYINSCLGYDFATENKFYFNAVGLVFILINLCLIAVALITFFKTVKILKQAN